MPVVAKAEHAVENDFAIEPLDIILDANLDIDVNASHDKLDKIKAPHPLSRRIPRPTAPKRRICGIFKESLGAEPGKDHSFLRAVVSRIADLYCSRAGDLVCVIWLYRRP